VEEKDLFAQCLEASEGILARWGWRLLTAEELARRAQAHLMAKFTAPAGFAIQRRVIQHTALRLYGSELYQACGHQDGAIRERAFTELWAYLYPIALYKAEDAALAQELDTTPTNVYALKSRALARLRGDQDFMETLADLVRER
jgi:hypothetical protein